MSKKTKPLKSLSIFFPFYNDAGTVARAIDDAYDVGEQVAAQLEVIAIHGGNSKDETLDEIKKAKKKFPDLIIIDKTDNIEGYAVIKYGLRAAKTEWVFYTDGDLQYSLGDLNKLVKIQEKTNADVVNGFKVNRGDSWTRTLLGELYKKFTIILFKTPITDPTCDFRLIHTNILKKCQLLSTNASICVELVKELQLNGASFAEVPVQHTQRKYGKSNYKSLSLLLERLFGDLLLWIRLKRRYNKTR